MITNEMNLVKKQFNRVGDKLEHAEPGTPEFKELLQNWHTLLKDIQDDDKNGVDAEFREAEFLLREQELKKPFWKRLEFWLTIFSGAVGLRQVGRITRAEDRGAVTSKALSFVHKMRGLK